MQWNERAAQTGTGKVPVTTSNKPTTSHKGTIPLPLKATVPLFYKYSSLATPEHMERLRIIIQEHELYLPNLDQLNDPADGRPRLARLSEEEMSHFLYQKLVSGARTCHV